MYLTPSTAEALGLRVHPASPFGYRTPVGDYLGGLAAEGTADEIQHGGIGFGLVLAEQPGAPLWDDSRYHALREAGLIGDLTDAECAYLGTVQAAIVSDRPDGTNEVWCYPTPEAADAAWARVRRGMRPE